MFIILGKTSTRVVLAPALPVAAIKSLRFALFRASELIPIRVSKIVLGHSDRNILWTHGHQILKLS